MPYVQPEVPFCIIGKVTWGVVTACKVPESLSDYYVRHHGFKVLIRDSDFPVELCDSINALQSNPRRQGDGDEGDQA